MKFYKFTEDIAKCGNQFNLIFEVIRELMQQEQLNKDRPMIGYKIESNKVK